MSRRPVPRTELIGVEDVPQVLVVVGDDWPGDDRVRELAAAEWNAIGNAGLAGDLLPEPPRPDEWWIDQCRRWRWVPGDPGADYARWLVPVTSIERGSFWGVLVGPTQAAYDRAERESEEAA